MTSGGVAPGERPLWRRAIRVAAIVAAVLAGLTAGCLGVLQIDAVGTRFAVLIARAVVPAGTLDVSIDRVSGSWIRSLRIAGLRITSERGDTVASVDTLLAGYRLLPLLRHHVDVRSVRLTRPFVRLARHDDRKIGIEAWPASSDAGGGGTSGSRGASGWRITVRSLDITGADGRLTSPLNTVRPETTAGAPTDRTATGNPTARDPAGAPARATGGSDVVLAWSDVDLSVHDLVMGHRLAIVIDSLTGNVAVPTLPSDAGVGPLEFRIAGNIEGGRVAIPTLDMTGPHTRVTGGGTLALADSSAGATDIDFRLDVDSLPLAILHAALGNPPDRTARLSGRVVIDGSTEVLSANIDADFSDGGRITGSTSFSPDITGPVRYVAALDITGVDPAFITGDTSLAGRIDGRVDVDLEGIGRDRLNGRADANIGRLRMGRVPLRTLRLESAWATGTATIDVGLEGDALSAGIRGTVRPLDPEPAYDVRGPFRIRVAGDSTDIATATGHFTIAGTGFVPGAAHAAADVRLTDVRILEGRLDAGTLIANLDTGRIAWRLAARTGEAGRLNADGDIAIGHVTTFRVDHATVRSLDVAAFMGDTVPARLDANLTATGEFGAPERLRSTIRLTVKDARYGRLIVDTTAVEAVLADGRLRATGRARSNAGNLAFEGIAHPFLDAPDYELTRLRFDHIDVGALGGDSAQSTDISGTARGRGHGIHASSLAFDLTAQLDTSRVNRQYIRNATITVGLRDVRADLRADIAFTDSGGIRLAITGRPFEPRPDFTIREAIFSALDPVAISRPAISMPVSLNGSVTGSLEGRDVRALRSSGTIELDASLVRREPIRSGRIDWRMSEGRLNANARLDLADGSLDAGADVRFAGPDTRYIAQAKLHSARPGRLAGIPADSGRLDATLSIDGSGTRLSRMSTRIRAAADSTTIGDIRVDTLRLAVLVDNGFLRLDTLIARSNVVDVTGSGGLPVADTAVRPADLALEATIRSLRPLESAFRVEPLGLDSGAINLAVSGLPDSLTFEARAIASELLLGRTRLRGFESTVNGQLGRGLELRFTASHSRLDRLTFRATTVRLSSLDARWNGDEIAVEGSATVDDRRDVDFATRIDPRRASARAVLERLNFRVDQDQWHLDGTPTISWVAGLGIDSLTLRAGDQSVSLHGLLDTSGRSDMAARIHGLRIAGIADLLGYNDLEGTLTASANLEGSAAEPRITGGVDARLKWRGEQSSSVVATLSYDTLRLGVDASIRTDLGGALTVTGGLPLDLALTRTAEGDTTRLAATAPGSVDLVIRADSFGLQWAEPFLDPQVARGLAGRLQIDAHVTGTQAEPVLAGTIRLADGSLTVPRLGVTYDRAALRVTLDHNVARLDSARVRAGDGTMTIEGTVSLPELSLGQFDINARLDRFRAIHTNEYRVRTSGNAHLSGTTREPRLEGNLRLVETDIYLDNRVAGASVQPVQLSEEQIRKLEEYFGMPVRPPTRDPNALFDALAIDLGVSMSRDTWIRQRANPRLELQLTGDVQVTKAKADSMRFDGRVETVSRRSYVEQFGKRFSIDRGVMELQGRPAETGIDIRAVYRVPSPSDPSTPEVTITLDVGGTLDDLSLTLGSEPTMENADIVSYLATGRPAASSLDFQQNGSGGGLGTIGSEFALGQVAGLVEGFASEGIGLDVIDIQPSGLRGATLIAGRYLSPSVFVGFKQPIGRDTDNPNAANRTVNTQVELEYQALRWLLLNMEASSSTVSLLFRYRRAY